MITTTNLTKYYIVPRTNTKVLAIQDLNLSFETPGIYGIIGANGAGKTTLIKILMGLISVDSGDVRVLNFIPYRRDIPFLKNIGFVSTQKSVLDPHIPLETTLTLVGTMYGMSRQDIKNRIYTLAEQLHIRQKLYLPLRNLSLGERMKAEIISSIFHRPKVLFLDEPTIGLDFESQITIRSLIQEEQRENNSFIILTSHSIQDIKQLCKQIIIIDKGEKIYEGTVQDIATYHSSHVFIQLLIKELYS